MRKVYLLIDIENVSIKNRKKALEDLSQRLLFDGYEVYKIGLAAKNVSQLNEWKEMCLEIFDIDISNIKPVRAVPGYDSADMALCFIAGYWCKENELEKYPFIILSNDKVFRKVEIYIKQLNIDCLEYELDLESFKQVKRESTPIIFDKELYPYGYHEPNICIPYLCVVSHPGVTDHPITFIPIPNIGEEITLGSGNQKTDQHISLDYWDQGKHHSLYPIHSYIGYMNGQLYIRSAKGFRRGNRSVEINDEIINSADGNRTLHNGDKLKIGGFVFKVVIPKRFSERKLLISNDIDALIKNTEVMLHQWIRNVLQMSNENWWTELVRAEIRSGCDDRNESSNEHSYNYTFLKDLDKIVKDNWNLFSNSISSYYMSKGKFSKALSSFMLIRNKVMHPTRTDLENEELSYINDFCSVINEITHN